MQKNLRINEEFRYKTYYILTEQDNAFIDIILRKYKTNADDNGGGSVSITINSS